MTATIITDTERYTAERDDARMMLGAAIAEHGEDHTYERQEDAADCMYLTYETQQSEDEYDAPHVLELNLARPTGPACLVGHVLVNKGVPMHVLSDFEGNGCDDVLPNLSNCFDVQDGMTYTHPRIITAMKAAQSSQDRAETWGDAVAAFEFSIFEYETACRNENVEAGTL